MGNRFGILATDKKFKVYITEINYKDYTNRELKGIEGYNLLNGFTFETFAPTKEKVAKDFARLVALATHTKIIQTYSVKPYLTSSLEWTFSTKYFHLNFAIEEVPRDK